MGPDHLTGDEGMIWEEKRIDASMKRRLVQKQGSYLDIAPEMSLNCVATVCHRRYGVSILNRATPNPDTQNHVYILLVRR
jgi:hypothetical protein